VRFLGGDAYVPRLVAATVPLGVCCFNKKGGFPKQKVGKNGAKSQFNWEKNYLD